MQNAYNRASSVQEFEDCGVIDLFYETLRRPFIVDVFLPGGVL
jgi:hypothetical protein